MSTIETLPRIASPIREDFKVPLHAIEDLFFHSSSAAKTEWVKLQRELMTLENSKVLGKCYNSRTPMNRSGFIRFAQNASGLEEHHASEIFSCATDSFDESDVEMNSNQFSVGIVRLANLWSIGEYGMDDASALAEQTSEFLRKIELQ